MYSTRVKEWLAHRAEEDERLYERYGKPLEREHRGEFAAISSEGQTLVGPNPDEILQQAIDTFGSGNFALVRIGEKAFGTWLSSSL